MLSSEMLLSLDRFVQAVGYERALKFFERTCSLVEQEGFGEMRIKVYDHKVRHCEETAGF